MNDITLQKHPKQIIIDYYDSLINKLDIYVEELLTKYNENDVLGEPERKAKLVAKKDEKANTNKENVEKTTIKEVMDIDEEFDDEMEENDASTYSYWEYDHTGEDDENIYIENDEDYQEKIYRIEEFTNPYYFKHMSDKHLHHKVKRNGTIKIRDYLNDVRSFLIKEIRKAQSEALESYELSKDGYKFDKDNSIEDMREELFRNRFCFLLDTQSEPNNKDTYIFRDAKKDAKREFNMCTVITDFYLNESQLKVIQTYFNNEKKSLYDSFNKLNRSDFILNEKNLFLQYIAQNIRFGLKIYQYKVEVFSITKESLLRSEYMDYHYPLIPKVFLPRTLTIDFSHLKSLTIRRESYIDAYKNCEVQHLGGLNNLEYLEIRMMFINQRAFIGLDKLIKLVLDCCKIKKLDDTTFISQRNLQFLQINGINCYVRLVDSLKNLRLLALLSIDKFKYIRSIPTEKLQVLHLNTNRGWAYINPDAVYRFFKRANLNDLPHLRVSRTEMDSMNSKCFSHLSNVKRLCLCDNMFESIDFFKNVNFSRISELDLSTNKLKHVEIDCFTGLKSLKWLNLSDNPFHDLKPGVFNGLENLETLLLQDLEKIKIEKDSLIGLNNLRILDLSNFPFGFHRVSLDKFIDSEALEHTPKLDCLRIKNCILNFNENMIPRLKQLKMIVMYEIDLDNYEFDMLSGLHLKLIEDI